MDLPDHVLATDLTARYPDAGTGTIKALTYCALGLAGESSEVLEKTLEAPVDPDQISAELGDVNWYFSRLHRELGLDVNDTIAVAGLTTTDGRSAVLELVIACGRVAELMKKALRDDAGTITEARLVTLRSLLPQVLACWLDTHLEYGLEPGRTSAANIDKLLDRRDRGVLAGSGDRR